MKNQLRAALVALLRDLGSYLTVTSAGDLAKLQSSMFPYQKPIAEPIGTLD